MILKLGVTYFKGTFYGIRKPLSVAEIFQLKVWVYASNGQLSLYKKKAKILRDFGIFEPLKGLNASKLVLESDFMNFEQFPKYFSKILVFAKIAAPQSLNFGHFGPKSKIFVF